MKKQFKTWTFDINPIAASRPRVSKYGHAYFTGPYKEFRGLMEALVADRFTDTPLYQDVSLEVEVVCRVKKPKTTKLTCPRGDVDNFAKSVLDSFNGIIWDDDKNIVRLIVQKEWAAEGTEGNFSITVKEFNV